MARIMRIVGARPQFMQVPTVRRELEKRGHQEILLHTGQHYDHSLSSDIFSSLSLPEPDIFLHIGSGPQGWQTGHMLVDIEAELIKCKPDAVIVDGDTNSTLAGALAAKKLGIPLFHIEAGLRADTNSPPEEVNRMLTDRCASLNFSPVPEAVNFLQQENLEDTAILTGDVLLDCMLSYKERASFKILNDLNLKEGSYSVLTIHRVINTTPINGEIKLFTILKGLAHLENPVIFPVHPRTLPLIDQYIEQGGKLGAIKLIKPIPYLEMIGLLQKAAICITDSGGLQREALWLGIPTAVCMDYNPWSPFIQKKWVYQTPINEYDLSKIPHRVPHVDSHTVKEYFGGGYASQKIAEAITNYLQ
jgi:UDP-N-acetylglucosamine 2-epimerase